ncbi:MAG: NADH:ubiquinone reductase (Na(+)-transporting) subunit F [Gemmatimonadota bacterium]|nr:NADH:ubiquinone reductase (Na(+)-transporting) subunit F [Gemmatimonadota bacterium]MDP6803525.1 NADH:ubiquinone reductase (Na(+)-transporting) subunit F [Gemmatimonadota bacterium]MDP7032534.1 NADH:ubiquinone reductase (Na(+)-transporting) subunit F [Gemmatimonadota bacterium]
MELVGLVGLSALIFTGTILFLVVLLSIAESKLISSGPVRILINDDEEKSPVVQAGSTLLNALTGQKIFLPSACGGGGTCAMCKCQVLDGGGDILPTEVGHLTRAEQKEHWRLACQVKVKTDMEILVAPEIFSIKKFDCTVRSNENVATFIKELILDIDDGQSLDFRAGGYIQIEIPPYELSYKEFEVEEEYRQDWDQFNLWKYHAKNDETVIRAYSMANHPAEGQRVMLNVRIASPPPGLDVPPGIASSYIFNLKPGDKVVVSGPYGEFFAKETDREMMYIGGGAGMAPMRSHIFDLFHSKRTERKVTFWYGARSLREMFYDDDFKGIAAEFPNFSYNVGLSEPLPEDDWNGPVGFIHQVILDSYLKGHEAPEDIEYYLCGPPMMISAVNKMLDDLGVDPSQIAYDSF